MTQRAISQIDAVTEDHLRWVLAFATVICQRCHGTGNIEVQESVPSHGPHEGSNWAHYHPWGGGPCLPCDGGGSIYVLEGVRRPCPCLYTREPDDMCPGCNAHWDSIRAVTDWHTVLCGCCGYGEVPAEGLETWIGTAWSLDLSPIFYQVGVDDRLHPFVKLLQTEESARRGLPDIGAHAHGESKLDALLRALAQALEAQGVKLAGEYSQQPVRGPESFIERIHRES